MTSSNLQIGGVPLRPDRFGSEALGELSNAVSKSAVRKAKKASSEVLDSWSESATLSSEELTVLNGYASESAKKYQELKSKWWSMFKAKKTGKAVLDVETRMAKEGNLLNAHGKLVTELREATARASVMATAGSLAGPAGIVAAYAAYANDSSWSSTADRNTGELLLSVNNLNNGTSRMITEGNEVKQVHREELWKTMNQTLDKAVADGKAGKPQELDLQYYELTSPAIIGKIADAAKAGNKVRVNLDAGRLSFPSKDAGGDDYFSLDATPDKIRTILQLATLKDADIAVSLFPQKKLIRSANNLMHRKIMRYGDDVLISGMNANLGSGENIDSGYVVRGPGARHLVENFARDVKNSTGATLEDIWGSDHIEKFQETNLRLGKRGFTALFDSLSGPSPAGTILPSPQTLPELEALAEKAGASLGSLVNVSKSDYEKVMTKVAEREAEVELSKKGKEMMRTLIERAIEVTTSSANVEKLADIELPSGEKIGKTRVDVADYPVERETVALEAIAEADKFIYLPGFVVTRAVAAAIIARRDQLRDEGKSLDVRVIGDSGIYPHGGTPNSFGVKHLEDAGIQPRWSKLERSNWHDRKIHAKQMITDKGEITGSTNFSNKGFVDNWETSAYIHFDPSDETAMANAQASQSQFENLWDTSFELSSRDHAAFLNRARGVEPSQWTVDEDRDRSIRHVLRLLINYEKESAQVVGDLLKSEPKVAQERDRMVEEGYSLGDASLMAVRAHLGEDGFRARLDQMAAAVMLSDLQKEVSQWKAEQAGPEAEAAVEVEPFDSADFRRKDFYIGNRSRKEEFLLSQFV